MVVRRPSQFHHNSSVYLAGRSYAAVMWFSNKDTTEPPSHAHLAIISRAQDDRYFHKEQPWHMFCELSYPE
jgi:hypothetical protein